MNKIKIGIIGHSGRLGKPLLEILNKHPFAEVVYTKSRSKGVRGKLSAVKFMFLALPHGESENYLAELNGMKMIDLSIDHRNDDSWVYGLPEIFRNAIGKATRVANPGCYATSILLGLFPLKRKIKSANIASTSGISGAGIGVSKEDNFMIYGEGRQHPQIKEIERILEIDNILFVPQRIDVAERGIVSTIFVQMNGSGELLKLCEKTYKKSPFIRMKKEIETKNVVGTNFCDIKILESKNGTVIISALDNLIKGGAGQAVQNFNLMCGFEETLGLV